MTTDLVVLRQSDPDTHGSKLRRISSCLNPCYCIEWLRGLPIRIGDFHQHRAWLCLSPISFPLSIANNLLIAQISIRTFCVAQLTQAVIETSTQGMDAAQHRTCEVAHGVGGKLAPGAGRKCHSRRCQLWLQNSQFEGLCEVLSHSVAC